MTQWSIVWVLVTCVNGLSCQEAEMPSLDACKEVISTLVTRFGPESDESMMAYCKPTLNEK